MKDLKISQFLEKLSSGEPIPGGGSASAFAGALSASLIGMVAALTIGKKGYENVKTEMEEIRKDAESIQKKMLDAVEDDSRGFEGVIGAYRLPKETVAQRQERSRSIQEAYKRATQTPLEISHLSIHLLALCTAIIERGNISAISDAGVALYLADTTLKGGLLNVMINLGAITDETFIKTIKENVVEIEKQGSELRAAIQNTLSSKMSIPPSF